MSILQSSLVFASNPCNRFAHLSIDDGLPQNTANSILQDSQGFLWVGTQDGLACYDAYTFRVFKNKAGDIHSLSANDILVIYLIAE